MHDGIAPFSGTFAFAMPPAGQRVRRKINEGPVEFSCQHAGSAQFLNGPPNIRSQTISSVAGGLTPNGMCVGFVHEGH